MATYSGFHLSRPAKRVALAACLATLGFLALVGCDNNTAPVPLTPALTPAAPTAASTIAPDIAPTQAPALVTTQPLPTTTSGLPLAGHRIGLDPGHGPRGDMGAVLTDPDTGKLILSEAELNLNIALRVRDLLQARGATVVLTRETADSFTQPWPPDTNGDGTEHDQYDDLQERVDILNNAHVEVFLSMHSNSDSDPAKRKGIQAYYCDTPDCAFPQQSKRLGTDVLAHLKDSLDQIGITASSIELKSDFWSDSPGAPATHLFMTGPVHLPSHVRATQMPGALAEAFYVTSPSEAQLLLKDSVRQTIAEAYAGALQDYVEGK